MAHANTKYTATANTHTVLSPVLAHIVVEEIFPESINPASDNPRTIEKKRKNSPIVLIAHD
jgi:hypothetical protein